MSALFSDTWMKQLKDAWNDEPEVKDKLAEIGFNSVIYCGFKSEDNPRGVFVVENGICVRAGAWSPTDPPANWDMRADLGDFRLLDRRAVEAFKRLPERTRFVKGLFAWIGMQRAEIPYDRAPRAAGRSSWSYWRLWNFALDGILSHSSVPLRVWTYGGAAIAVAALAFALYRVVRTLVWGVDVPGYASIMVAILFIGGVQILSIGVLGEYIGRIYEETKRRPLYLVDETAGGDPAAAPGEGTAPGAPHAPQASTNR